MSPADICRDECSARSYTDRSRWLTSGTAAGFYPLMVSASLFTGPDPCCCCCCVAAVYTDDDDVAELVSTLVWLFLINLLAGGFTQALRGILNGCGQQVVNARISLICGWVIGMPISAALCYGIGPFPAMGVVGLWIGLGVSSICRAGGENSLPFLCFGVGLVCWFGLCGVFVSLERRLARCGNNLES